MLRFELEAPALVSFELSGPDRRELLENEPLKTGTHRVEIQNGRFSLDGEMRADVPAGKWQWRAFSHTEFKPVIRGQVCQPAGIAAPGSQWRAADGVPSAVACDAMSVYLGSNAGQGSGSLVALDPEGNLRWTHQRKGLGVHALGCDHEAVIVLADSGGASGGVLLYKLDAKTGLPLPWGAAKEFDLPIASLWPATSDVQPYTADAMTAGNGRIYLSFTDAGFIAVLDSGDGHYVTTITGPEPKYMSVSATPMRSEDGQQTVADFGVAVLGESALTYFVMPHDPPWVAFNTTHLLAEDEKITAFTMAADTMKSSEVDLYVALGPPYFQVQRKRVDEVRGFSLSAGKTGGRASALGPWDPDALRSIKGIGIDAGGNLWIAEGDAWPKRFSLWKSKGSLAKLEREFFPPVETLNQGAALFPEEPDVLVAAGCEWKINAKTGQAACLGVITGDGMQEAGFINVEGRHLLVVGTSPAITIYERTTPGNWRLLSRIRGLEESTPIYWADINGDGLEDPSEIQVLVMLKGGVSELGLEGYPIKGWTACGAPLFNWEQPFDRAQTSSESRLLAMTLPERDRSTLVRFNDGRAFYIGRENGFSVVEITGAASLRKLGEGAVK
ncbi:MAG: hypothetical protein JWL90_85 [Chthoniobacteraceae bacterium]|nr:hypothetical protein [Chthoniobacteraceae bacterium]